MKHLSLGKPGPSRLWLITLLLLPLLFASSYPAMAGAPLEASALAANEADDDDGIEEIDDIEEVEVIQATGTTTGEDGLLVVLGKLHPAIVHLPIAWLFLLLLFDIAVMFLGREELERASLYVLIGTALSFVPALASGLLRERVLGKQPLLLPLIETHEAIMFAASGALFLALVLRLSLAKRLTGKLQGAYIGLITLAVALVAIGGHWGGKIVFGPGHLPF